MIKKLTFLFVGVLIVLFAGSKAQAQTLKKSDVLLNAGFGFPEGSTLIDLNGEYGVADNIGVGALLQFITRSGSKPILGVKGNYHLGQAFQIQNEKLDPYVGLSVNKLLVDGAKLGVGGQLGFRYMFQEQFGAGIVYNLYFGEVFDGFNHFGIHFTYKISK